MIRLGSSVEWLKDIDQHDAYSVGPEIARSGELCSQGIPFSPAFVIPNSVYLSFLKYNNLEIKINHLLNTIHYDDQRSVAQVAFHIQNVIKNSHIFPDHLDEILSYYKQLTGVLARSSVTIRPFTLGTYQSIPLFPTLTITGEAVFAENIKETYAQVFSTAVLVNLHEQRLSPFALSVSLLVSKVLAPDISGVMFTVDPVTNNKDLMVIEAARGLKELFLEGELTPDHYEVDAVSGKVLHSQISPQDVALVQNGGNVKRIKIPRFQQKKAKLDEKFLQQLAQLGKHIQKLLYFPQDVEWCLENKVLFVTSLNQLPVPEVQPPERARISAEMRIKPLLSGIAHGRGVYSGPVKIVKTAKQAEAVRSGDILVIPRISYEFLPTMKKAGAIVSEQGGLASELLQLQNFGKPLVSGISDVVSKLKTDMVVTVNGDSGEIYRGSTLSLENDLHDHPSEIFTRTKTKIIVMTDPAESFDNEIIADGAIVDGGKIINAFGIHPRKLLREGEHQILSNKIDIELSHAYDSMFRFTVLYQLSDLPPNDYKKLLGGKEYEQYEQDSVIGYRGAYRLLHEPDLLNIELFALKQFQQRHKPATIQIVLPTVRTKNELLLIEKLIRTYLPASTKLKIWFKVDTPMVALSVDQYITSGTAGLVMDITMLTMLLTGIGSEAGEHDALKISENPVLQAIILRTIKAAETQHKQVLIEGVKDSDTALFDWLIGKRPHGVIVSRSLAGKIRTKIASIEKGEFTHGSN